MGFATKKKPTVLLAVLLIVSLAVGGVSCKSYLMPENEDLPGLIQANMGDETLDLRSVTDFEWDTVYLIGQYMPVDEVLENDGVRYVNMTNPMNDGAVLVFCLDKEIVSYCNLYSDVNDYSVRTSRRDYEDPIVIIKNRKIVPDGWTDIRPIKEP
jgi:hypothetical protein